MMKKFVIKLSRFYNKYVWPKFREIRGFGRIKAVLEKIYLREEDELIRLNLMDTSLFSPNKTMQAVRLNLGEHKEEIDQLNHLLSKIEDGDSFVDIGGSFGLFSNIIHEKTGAEVRTFEPLPKNIIFLKLNKEIFDREYDITEKAVGDEKGKEIFYTSEESLGRGSLQDESNEGKIEVTKTRLDDEVDNVDFVKIDIEGGEFNALKGMENTIEENKPQILLELHSEGALKNFDASQSEVIEWLEKKEYELLNMNKEEVTLDDLDGEMPNHLLAKQSV